jgi:hypothetical protein
MIHAAPKVSLTKESSLSLPKSCIHQHREKKQGCKLNTEADLSAPSVSEEGPLLTAIS